MLGYHLIMEKVKSLWTTEYPSIPLYTGRWPDSFTGPGILMQYSKGSQEAATCRTVKHEVHLRLICAGSETKAADELQQELLALFDQNYLAVADRCIEMKTEAGLVEKEDIPVGLEPPFVGLQFTYFDDRGKPEEYPVMQKIQTKMIKE